MLDHYLKMAFRSLLRNKLSSIINILGLAVGMGVCLLIFQYIHFELSFDKFHKDADRVYRLTTTEFRNGVDLGTEMYTTYAVGPSSKTVIPAVKDFARVHPQKEGLIVINSEKNIRNQENNIWYADSSFFEMFNFKMKYGSLETALKEKHNIILTEKTASKYFGDINPVGETLRVSGGTLSGDFVVTGVLNKLPLNSHLQFDFLIPMQFVLENWRLYREEDGWGWNNFVTYVKLEHSANLDAVGKKFDELISRHSEIDYKIGLQSLTDIHLKAGFSGDIGRNNGSIQNVYYFAIIALFILLMAWINYINLSTAKAINRAKEVGIRKSIGANKKELIVQFLFESGCSNVAAFLLAVCIASFLLTLRWPIQSVGFEFNILYSWEFWVWSSIFIVLGTLISGLCPAFILSSFKPITVFKSENNFKSKGVNLRKCMIAFQFAMSILLLSGTYVVYKQIIFMKTQDLGMDIKKILVVIGPRVILETERQSLGSIYQTFKTQGNSHHSISGISATSDVPGKGYSWKGSVQKLGDAEGNKKDVNMLFVDSDFTDTYGVEILAQRKFPDKISPYEWVIINEETVRDLGLGSPEEALNEKISFFDDTLKIVAVVKNVHWSSLRDANSPVLFMLDEEYGAYFSINMNLTNIQESISHMKSAFHSAFPNDPFDYFFLEDDFNRQYQADLQFGKLFSSFSMLAIFIACLGLFALVSFSATLRMKEIGVRKILGASVNNLMLLLSREYLMLLLIAVLISFPVVIYAANSWLNNYAYRVGIGIDILLIPVLILSLISFLTVSYRTYKTARTNPVQSLKSE